MSPSVIAAGIVTEQTAPPSPQLMPAPWTAPPAGGSTVIAYGGPTEGAPPDATNLALHVRIPLTCTVVVCREPAQSPPHPLKVKPLSGTAVKVAEVALANVTWQAEPPVPHMRPPQFTVPP
ncbi:MAG TPA: hypothetical protein PLT35_11485, partial [Vicinamibacterales bacterium]|nr:hypothetical protein [Vicinamibacterales bacterium]